MEAFLLMNKDQPVLKFAILQGMFGTVELKETERYTQLLPLGFRSIQSWIEGRQAPKHREHIAELMRVCGCSRLDGFVKITHALSLNDTFWTKPEESSLKWDEVSLYKNEFDETIAKIAFDGGMYGARFSTTSPEFETDGSFAKCWVRDPDGTVSLLKRGSSGSRNAGLEPFSEVYASQVAHLICKDFVPYTSVMHHGKLASKCPLFTNEKTGFAPIYKCLQTELTVTNVLRYMAEHGAEDAFRRMLVLDALILNTDRHAGNYGMMFDTDTLQILKMGPVFDHNQALLPYAEEEDFLHLEEYLATRPTRIGEDFNEIAYEALTPEIRADLIQMKGFQFQRNQKIGLPEERLKALEGVINLQIDQILKRKQLYLSKGSVRPASKKKAVKIK